MKKLVTLLLASVFLLVGARLLSNMNAAPTAVIKVDAISTYESEEEGIPQSTGLWVVGKGEMVYLIGEEAEEEEVTAWAWTLTGPTGSTAALSSTTEEEVTFRPDMVGDYTVELTITTASGSGSVSKVITASTYAGVGNIAGATPNVGAGQCATCHSGNTASWAETGHATMFTLAIDGLKSSHYGESCIGCHTLGFNTDPEAVNGGFDDVATSSGWTFPDTLVAGNWDDMVANYPALTQLTNIQCENCHGAGASHMGNKAKIAISINEGVCGKCHEDGNHHTRNLEWATSGHGSGETYAEQGTSATCAPCHSGWGLIAKLDPASDLELKVGAERISCAACHDPHDATNEHQVRLPSSVTLASGPTINWGGTGRLCMSCHVDRRAGGGEEYVKNPTSTFRGPHHSNQTDMLAGASSAVITFGRVLPNSTHKDVVEDACVGCHMAPTDRWDLGGHSWNMSAEGEGGEEIDNIEPCQACHGAELESFDDIMARADYDGDGDVEAAQAEVEGLLEEIAMMLPPFGEPTVDIRAPIWNTEESLLLRKAAWNYAFVSYDHSHGVHNYQFTVALLQLTKAVLEDGVLSEGVIADVDDVPNDQGKQVMVSWTKFAGDGASGELQSYYVWRRVDAMGKSAPEGTYKSFAEVPADPSKLGNAHVMADGALWTAVGSQPAAQLDMYAAVVPTLADSTKDGAVWSVFKVTGHTKVSQVYVETLADSGYSVDNLAPMAPTGVAAAILGPTVSLTWEEAKDADVEHFQIYRSEQSGFVPSGDNFIGKVGSPAFRDWGVENGKTYYYRVAAFDFAGNRGAASEEVSLVVTVGLDAEGVPTEFALKQNYPNPFNPQTRITFAVPEASHVKITVVDVSGKEVAVLVDATRQPGTYSLTWDAGSLASGVYIYRMEAGKHVQARTMTLLR